MILYTTLKLPNSGRSVATAAAVVANGGITSRSRAFSKRDAMVLARTGRIIFARGAHVPSVQPAQYLDVIQ
jgi:hypothetical protein